MTKVNVKAWYNQSLHASVIYLQVATHNKVF